MVFVPAWQDKADDDSAHEGLDSLLIVHKAGHSEAEQKHQKLTIQVVKSFLLIHSRIISIFPEMARIPLAKQITIFIFNLLFPPLAVGLLTGFTSRDTFINCLLFLCAVIPAHIHGFMISMTYFHRKRKVRKNRFPGDPPSWTKNEKVVTGGAGWREYEVMRGARGRRSWKTLGMTRKSTVEDNR